MKKTICYMLIVVILISSMGIFAQAESANDNIYEETDNEINLEYLTVSVSGGTELQYRPRTNVLLRTKANRENEKLKKLLEKAPQYEQILIDMMNQNMPIHTISTVDAPLVEIDGHYERVKKANNSLLRMLFSPFLFSASAAESNIGKTETRGNFQMCMTISKVYNQTEKRYKYLVISSGQWTGRSALGGADYPAMGEDLVAMTSPQGTCILTSNMSAEYGNYKGETRIGSNSTSNPDYWLKEVDDNYCAYSIKEDPLWTWQLNWYVLSADFVGLSDTRTRKARTKYEHTWSEVEFTIEIDMSLSNWEETIIAITPTRKEKSWELSCFVTFDF